MRPFRLSAAPIDATPTQRRNFLNVQIDAIGIGLANAASPFLPVFLTRLGASNLQVSLLTTMPGVTGLFLSLVLGRFLQRQRNIVPWFSAARLLVVSSYAATGLAPFLVPEQYLVGTVLAIWAIATLPQTAVAICFSVVMNAVAGPTHRYDLMSRRWSILGLVTALTTALTGQILETIGFPINYQVVFVGLSLGGLVSYYFSSRISLPEVEPPPSHAGMSLAGRLQEYLHLILEHKDFVYFSAKRFVFWTGVTLATPLIPLYLVREVQASDAWIGLINTTQTAVLMVGYFVWSHTSRRRGSRYVLLVTTLGLSAYPALLASSHQLILILAASGLAGIFQAGIDLVFFDELMKTVPVEHSATFVSIAQSIQFLSAIIAPLIGSWVATQFSLPAALFFSAAVRLIGFMLFVFWKPKGR